MTRARKCRNTSKNKKYPFWLLFLYICPNEKEIMNIYNRSSPVSFYKKHPDCKETIEKWYHDVQSKNWKRPGEVTRDFNTARTIKNNRAIFKINQNDHRLIAEINYQKGWLFVKFIGTHAQYDAVDAEKVNQFKSKKK